MMRQFFVITWWEFIRHFKSRSFLLSTFISPLVFAAVMLIPTLYIEDSSINRLKIIGCMEFDTTGICRNIRQRFTELNADSPLQSFIQLITIRTDTSVSMKNRFNLTRRLKLQLDSLDNNYNRIKERRKFVFQKPAGTSRGT